MLKRNMTNNLRKKKKGQSTVEYILLFATIIAALVIFLGPGGPFSTKYNKTLSSGTDGMTDMANRLLNSR